MQQYTLSVKLLPLRRDVCKCHRPRGARIFTQQEGPAVGLGSDLGGDDPSVSCLALFAPSVLHRVSPSLSSLFLVFPSVYSALPLPLPFPVLILSRALSSFILSSHSALLCPCYHGYCLLRMRWGGKRTDGRYRGMCYSCHSSLPCSLSFPLKSLSLSSLQLTAAGGKSC